MSSVSIVSIKPVGVLNCKPNKSIVDPTISKVTLKPGVIGAVGLSILADVYVPPCEVIQEELNVLK